MPGRRGGLFSRLRGAYINRRTGSVTRRPPPGGVRRDQQAAIIGWARLRIKPSDVGQSGRSLDPTSWSAAPTLTSTSADSSFLVQPGDPSRRESKLGEDLVGMLADPRWRQALVHANPVSGDREGDEAQVRDALARHGAEHSKSAQLLIRDQVSDGSHAAAGDRPPP